MINEIQHGNITTTASRGQGGSRFEPQPKGYGMSQNPQNEWGQATFDSVVLEALFAGENPTTFCTISTSALVEHRGGQMNVRQQGAFGEGSEMTG